MRELIVAALLVMVVRLGDCGFNPSICTKPTPDPAHPFPNIPNDFQAKFLWTEKDSTTSVYIEEVFVEDYDLGVMVAENLVAPGVMSKLIFVGVTNEVIFVEDATDPLGSCSVSKMDESAFQFPYRKTNDSNIVFLLSGKDVLTMGASDVWIGYVPMERRHYIRHDGKNDTSFQVFEACLYDKVNDFTYNATYFFITNETTGDQWKTASGYLPMIKRIHLAGGNATSDIIVDRTYEYAYFTADIPDRPGLFEVPRGTYCEGRKTTRDPPMVPDYFTFSMEVLDKNTMVVTYTDEWYDSKANYTRMDTNKYQDASNMSQIMKLVHDYNAGLQYSIDKYGGACQIGPIPPDMFDNILVDPSNGTVRLRTPKEFFDFNDPKYPWQYEGQHHVRDVMTDAWISKRPFPTDDSSELGYWEWYFTTDQTVLSNGKVDEILEPFQLLITVPSMNVNLEYNIYDFNQEEPDSQYFDISECSAQHNGSRSYEFIMQANVAKYQLDTNVQLLKYWVAMSLEAFAGVRAIRVVHIQFEFAVNQVYVHFTLLDRPNVNGNVEDPVDMISLDDAEAFLTSSIQQQQFTVFYIMADGTQTQFNVDPKSLSKMEFNRGPGTSVYYVISDDGADGATAAPVVVDAAVSRGAAAGIAIIMIFIGAGITVTVFVVLTRKNKALQAFQRSQLTMSDMQD